MIFKFGIFIVPDLSAVRTRRYSAVSPTGAVGASEDWARPMRARAKIHVEKLTFMAVSQNKQMLKNMKLMSKYEQHCSSEPTEWITGCYNCTPLSSYKFQNMIGKTIDWAWIYDVHMVYILYT